MGEMRRRHCMRVRERKRERGGGRRERERESIDYRLTEDAVSLC